jgi:ABC-type multidrug transport system, ATPase and permease components
MSEQNKNMKPMAGPGGMRGGRGGGPMGGPMGGFGMPGQKAKNFKVSLKRLISYLKPHKINLIVVVIFAIASTIFTIYAPKVTSKATNKLQDSYMARTMLSKMSEAQVKAIDELNKNMGEAQKKAVDQIDTKMAEGQEKAVDQISGSMKDAQIKAVDQITTEMSDAQVKIVNGIYDGMAVRVYNGVVSGQKAAVNGICTQMAAVQKSIVAQISLMMQQGTGTGGQAAQQMDPATVKALQDFMKLPAIDSIKDTSKKVETTLTMIDLLQKMPSMSGGQQNTQSGTLDPKMLSSIKPLLKLPMLDTVKDPNKKEEVVRSFLQLSKSLPSTGTTAGKTSQTTMQLDNATMEKVLSRIPYMKSTAQTSTTGTKMSKEETDALQDLLKLPMLNTITDQNQKNDTLIQLLELLKKLPDMSSNTDSSTSSIKMDSATLDPIIVLLKLPRLDTVSDPQKKLDTTLELVDVFKKMPSMDNGQSTDETQTKLDPAALETVQKLLKLPKISSITDPTQKAATVVEMVELFSKMPDMGTGEGSSTTKQEYSPETLDAIKQLLQLPDLNTIKDTKEKSATVLKMLDIFDKMPDMQTESDKSADTSSENQMSPESIKAVKDFLQLPMLNTLTDANQKADVCKKILDLSKNMQSAMKDAPENVKDKVEYTDDQIEGVIKAIRETNGEYDFKYIGMIALLLIAMYLVSSGFSLIMGLVMSGVAQKTVRDMRREVDTKLARLPLKYFDMHPHGDVLSRVTNDVDTISTTLQQSLTQIITSIITIIGYIVMMLTISPVLTLIVVGTLPLYIIVTTMIAKKSQKFFAAQQKELGDLSGHVEEMYTGHVIVKAFGHEKDSIEKFEDINGKLYNAGWKAQFVSGIMFPLMNFVSNLGYVLICIVGGIYITKNMLKLGDMLAFIQYSRSFTMPIVQTANIANIIQSTVACAERVFEILDEEEEIPDKPDALVISQPKGEVSFQHVDFRYKEDVPLINDMNLDVKQGHTIAIVGPTGAGKTTLVNLLMRFYEINAGKISVDGVDIRDVKRSDLRKMFGMVLQDTWLFNGTIKDNIAYGKENATMDEIKRAAKAAYADHFIRTLPEGYNTILNEEATNISQGQKQLLTIARAILADPAILILDEATSSVDTRTEVMIQKAMANLMQGRTSFVIAHRLSTIRDAETILVMNHGSIIEMGNHNELLSENGFYADLYNSQFAGANLE